VLFLLASKDYLEDLLIYCLLLNFDVLGLHIFLCCFMPYTILFLFLRCIFGLIYPLHMIVQVYNITKKYNF